MRDPRRSCSIPTELLSHHTTNTPFLPSGTGYIGSFTALALLEADYKVVIVDNLYNSSEEVLNRIELICGKRPEYYSLDITDEKALDKVFEEHPDIDNVIHFAALKVSSTIARGMEWSEIRDNQRLEDYILEQTR
jgi:UDP-glucose 4-epimerase